MKGLLLKNSYSLLRKNEMFILILLVMNAVFMTVLSDYSFMAVFTMFFAAVLVLDQIADERKKGYNEYEKILPVSIKDIVFSRYIFAFGFMTAAAATSFLATVFISYMFDYPCDYLAFGIKSLIFAGLAFLIVCIVLPFYYVLDTRIIRIINILIVAIPTVVNYFISKAGTPFIIIETSPFIIIAGILGASVITFFSMLLSIHFLKPQDADNT